MGSSGRAAGSFIIEPGMTANGEPTETAPTRSRRKRRGLALAAATVAADIAVLRRRGYGLGGRVVVRCRSGHLFTTIWIPAASVKAVRLGPYRLQRCPIGRHWSLVTPVDESTLTDDERQAAHEARDIRLP
jgi:hypothetical protein